MKRQAAELNLQNRLTWIGMVQGDLKWGAFRAAEVFILPSHQENFGISVVESLACGRPVLISDKVNIWREIIQDNAGLKEEDTVEGTQRLIEQWGELSLTQRDALTRCSTACFHNHFQVQGVANRLAVALSRLIDA